MDNSVCRPTPIDLLIVITDKGKGKKVTKIFNEMQTRVQAATFGHGTASKAIYDYLGLGETLKDVIFTILPDEKINETMEKIDKELNLEKTNSGIAFAVPIKCIASMQVLNYILEGGRE